MNPSRHSNDAGRRARQAGFTLLEVIVALVMTSLLVAILIGALYYVFRVQEMLQGEVVEREAALRARAWFVEVLQGCLPAEAGTPAALVGSAMQLRCETTTPLKPRRLSAPGQVRFGLQRAGDGDFALSYGEEAATAPLTVAQWKASDAYFRYVDAAGEELAEWPPSRAEPEALPRLIKLVIKAADKTESVWLAAPGADPWLPPKAKNLFGMDLPK